jgi:hypothetical protein
MEDPERQMQIKGILALTMRIMALAYADNAHESLRPIYDAMTIGINTTQNDGVDKVVDAFHKEYDAMMNGIIKNQNDYVQNVVDAFRRGEIQDDGLDIILRKCEPGTLKFRSMMEDENLGVLKTDIERINKRICLLTKLNCLIDDKDYAKWN